MGPLFLIWCSKDKFTVIWANVGIITTAITWNHWGFSTHSLSFVQSVALFVFTMWIHNHYRYRHFLRHFHSYLNVSLSLSLARSASISLLCAIPSLSQANNRPQTFPQSWIIYKIVHSFPIWTLFLARLLFDFHSPKVISKMNEYIYTHKHTRKHTLWLNLYSVWYQTRPMRCDTMRCWTVNTVQESQAYTTHNKNETHSCGKRLSHKLDTIYIYIHTHKMPMLYGPCNKTIYYVYVLHY